MPLVHFIVKKDLLYIWKIKIKLAKIKKNSFRHALIINSLSEAFSNFDPIKVIQAYFFFSQVNELEIH